MNVIFILLKFSEILNYPLLGLYLAGDMYYNLK